MSSPSDKELDNIAERYARRKSAVPHDRYSFLNPGVYMEYQERERAIIRGLAGRMGLSDIASQRVLEIGCGSGTNLLMLLKLGVDAANLVGNELLEERAAAARQRLPAAATILCGNAAEMEFGGGFDLIVQSTVFTSILSEPLRKAVAANMWRHLKPGGAVLWYDFVYDNPNNPDVRGIGKAEVARLFPEATVRCERITLAPPISRRVTRIHPQLYTLINLVPLLRTHILCWIEKKL